MISPRASGEFIAKRAKNVNVLIPGLQTLGDIIIKEINLGQLSLEKCMLSNFHPKPEDPLAFDWILVVNCLNFTFWQAKTWRVNGNRGSFALCAAIDRAIKQNVDILNPHFYSRITRTELSNILAGDGNVPISLIDKRVKVLHEVGICLINNFKGTFRTCVEQANNSAIKLLTIITQNFEPFKDEFEYDGSKVAFYKKAQMLIADIWVCFKNQGIGHFKDINEITMFADYRVPQTLLFYHVLSYSDQLTEKIRTRTLLKNGCNEELEIRGCTIYAVECLTKYVKEKLDTDKYVNAILIDHFLWEQRRKYGKELYEQGMLFHHTISVHY